jgi:flagellar biosynthesis/type III secretory pathway M-ring protein FliF/YscJ
MKQRIVIIGIVVLIILIVGYLSFISGSATANTTYSISEIGGLKSE